MPNIPKRKPSPYDLERDRLLDHLNSSDPESDEYETVMKRLDTLDKINRRSNELTKTIIPAISTIASVGGIYAIQQFGGVLVPKVLDAIASRSTQKTNFDPK